MFDVKKLEKKADYHALMKIFYLFFKLLETIQTN